MWFHYTFILISVVMFGGGFALQDLYRKKRGSGIRYSMESSCIGALAGAVVLLLINGLSFESTPFTLLMAVLTALDGMAFTFFAFKALDRINLSLFSLFAMLGGMALPFFQGILFYGEPFTLSKGVCVGFICAALLCTVERGRGKGGVVFYAGVFVLNGMAGVIAKLFTESTLPKASAAAYSAWCAVATAVLSGVVWTLLLLIEKRKTTSENIEKSDNVCKKTWQAHGIGALYGIINKVANFLLVLSLVHVDASVQYPMVTGGTMIVSTLISCFGSRKPSRREIMSVGLAFCGMLALFLIPV